MAASKAQVGIMEYLLISFFIMIVIVFLILFLGGWHAGQIKLEQKYARQSLALDILRQTLSSPYLVKEDSMFDANKLDAASDHCQELRKIFADGWFAIVSNGSRTWQICKKGENCIAYTVPVNIYFRNGYVLESGILPRVDIGNATVGVCYG